MPRKAYLADLEAASKQSCFLNISQVKAGADDGEIVFLYHQLENSPPVQISALIPDASDYPTHHSFHVFACENAPASVAQTLQDAPSFSKLALFDFLPKLSKYLDDKSKPQNSLHNIDSEGDLDMPDSQLDDALDGDSDAGDADNEDWVFEEDEFTSGLGDFGRGPEPSSHQNSTAARARADLKTLKGAGFKMGLIGDLTINRSCYISVACRIQKLGISEEAMEAWHVDPSNYLILLVHYPRGYAPMDYLKSVDAAVVRSRMEMRVGVSNTYKVRSSVEAQNAFKRGSEEADSAPDGGTGFKETFISRPLNGLMNERLVTILKYRLEFGLSWLASESLYTRTLGLARESDSHLYVDDMLEDIPAALPQLVSSDELSTHKNEQDLSFPLLAMQFLLRHFVRCTEFCLVCHCKLEFQCEAIKPYVCDNPLCLFQYMNLGFGPGIEHELSTQPLVVDLLVSFCYSAASAQRLNSYPEGLGLNVPNPSTVFGHQVPKVSLEPRSHQDMTNNALSKTTEDSDRVGYKCSLARTTNELHFDLDTHPRCPIRKGDWLVIKSDVPKLQFHCRVSETNLFPSMKLGKPVISPIFARTAEKQDAEKQNAEKQDAEKKDAVEPDLTAIFRRAAARKAAVKTSSTATVTEAAEKQDTTESSRIPVTVFVYDEDFDSLKPAAMCKTITTLLDLLPSVNEMRDYLARTPGAYLSAWSDRISPSALSVLRWIIASNRACIMQVDHDTETESGNTGKRIEERVQGIPSHLQFRFAMGAPDKEQRFINAITSRSKTVHKTIFAWHGSPLCNWHSIIREGLHFKEVTHGRVHGHGCYHAKDWDTSIRYTKLGLMGGVWPNSVLHIGSAVALSEIVNSPSEFISHHPHYVVSQLDWIQTRYLFVLPMGTDVRPPMEKPVVNILKQDPARTPTGPIGTPIVLPITAITKSRRPEASSRSMATLMERVISPNRSSKKATVGLDSAESSDDDMHSIDTEIEDLEVLFEPEEQLASTPVPPIQQPSHTLVTHFVIRCISDLPRMPMPQYATSAASKRLQKDFRSLLATQELYIKKGNLQELGWYVDPEHISRTDNLYQWILELHSFPLSLPLASDMSSSGIQSIVLEVRFHATYPFSPPFIRVVRPKFLPFAHGGGGHVTAGGSICLDLLTSSGWSAASDIESVLLQIRMAIMSKDPTPARLLNRGANVASYAGGDYGIGEAVEAFKRAARLHGWVMPGGLDEVASTNF